MIFIRILVIAFNVAVVTFLIYRMFQVAQLNIQPSRKAVVMIAGILLILAPLAYFLGVMAPGIQYFLIYPAAVSLFLYLIRQV